jgi:XTP/dITP diphosphohydrolase
MQLCFATNNHHKLDEVMGVLGGAFQLLSLRDIGCEDELPETQDTILGNAHQKAEYVWKKYHVPCFADDTGLEVEALGGAPGVHSAHYAGVQRSAEANMKLLLRNLGGIENRRAQFRTVISLIMPHGAWDFEGIVKGIILEQPRGTGGFGYDPVFLPHGSDKTLAEMSLSEKNQMSHRAIAVAGMAEFLKRL